MPPRIRLRASQLLARPTFPLQCRYASTAAATTPTSTPPPPQRYPTTQPPSYKPPQFRKSQLHRTYTSLLRSTPLLLLFQHNNLKSNEWTSLRRELANAMRAADASNATHLADSIKLQVIRGSMFAMALRVVEFWHPETTGPSRLTHGLSEAAYKAAKNAQIKTELEPLLAGPLVVLTLPAMSPEHLAVALSILAPSPAFPAPRRRVNPGYHEPAVLSAVQKLMLLGARAEGRVFDTEGARWIGGIEGGIDGLRAQVVGILQSFAGGLAGTLETASKSLYFTLEGRRQVLEDESKPEGKEEAKEEAKE
ncbi:hypothetical protein EJ06DRAFT_529577 [Trichodelitschia bisporula]|uniref:Ribosomal protein YmL11, mitochondrial n=1 Tax=Trichodelitschia bisporula TaxID=703511 RepID=A0A6G1HZL5_9PEZI|nr:hypothetical protein EJ06DRAFT_529577 [Trichodelitschia bisporula]